MSRRSCVLLAVSAGVLTLSAGVANAATPHAATKVAPTVHSAPARPAVATAYHVKMVMAPLGITGGTQAHGIVTCPVGYRVVGGGEYDGGDQQLSLNGSLPSDDGKSWNVYVNDTVSSGTTIEMYADCAKNVSGYHIRAGKSVDNPSGAQTLATAKCPTGTVPIGGGGLGSSTDTAVALNSSIPTARGWEIYEDNDSFGDDTVTATVVCATSPSGYAVVVDAGNTDSPGSYAISIAYCPGGTTILGGGGYSTSTSTQVVLSSSTPRDYPGWTVVEQNHADTGTSTIKAYAICGTF